MKRFKGFDDNGIDREGLRKPDIDKVKLLALREWLRSGEYSPLIDGFDGDQFLTRMHKKHISRL